MLDLAKQLQSELGSAYSIQGELGGGGMSRVFVAEDSALGRKVVVKLLSPELNGDINIERFRREIQFAAQIQHPCIVPVLSSGEMSGLPYYTMPFVAGESLRARLKRSNTLSRAEAVKVLRDVASALSCAHERGVVHRDMKPENVLLSSGYAMVTDFGVAKAVSSSLNAADTQLTALGAALGTPAYIAPEQVMADPAVDHRADIYAFGMMAYEMLNGSHPFAGRPAQAMLVAHVTEMPRTLAQRQPDLPAGLSALVMRCLAKQPQDRPQTAAIIVDELDAFSTVPGRNGGSGASRTTGQAAMQQTSTLPSIAVLPFTNISSEPENEYFSDGITEEILNALGQLGTIRVAARTSSFAFKGRRIDLREVGEELRVGTVLEGSVRRIGKRLRVTAQLIDVASGFHLWSGRYDRELADVFAIQDEIAGAIVDTLKLTLFKTPSAPIARRPTENIEAYEAYLRGRFFWNQGGASLKTALDLFQRAVALDPTFALAHTGVADAFSLFGIFELMPPAEAFRLARPAAERALALDDMLPEVHASLGVIHLFNDWDTSSARASLERAIELNPSNVNANVMLGVFHALAGDPAEALEWSRRAVRIDPLAASAHQGELLALYVTRRFAETIDCAKRVIGLNPGYGEAYRAMGMSYLYLGQAEKALASLRQAVSLPGPHAWTLGSLATALVRVGEINEAVELHEALNERATREFVSPNAHAAIHIALGEFDEAILCLERGYKDRDCWLVSLAREPAWDPLRGMPAFESLIARVGLGAAEVSDLHHAP